MSVKLISHSQASTSIIMERKIPLGLQEMIAYCARVSNPGNQNNHDTSEKLVRYLVDHKHWSPLEMVSACVEVTTTRDIARQILRHRSFSFQEFSQRYADPTENLGFVVREARLQDKKNRQNSIQLDSTNLDHAKFQVEWSKIQEHIIVESRKAYEWAIANGIAKEQARAVLPEGLTESRLYMSGTLRSFVHYIEVRTTPGTQAEHMDIAKKMAEAIAPVFPMIQQFVSS